MNFDNVNLLFGAFHFVVNLSMMCVIFPGRLRLPYTITGIVLSLAAFYSGHYLIFDTLAPRYGGLPALSILVINILLFKGQLFHILFAYFFQFFATSIQIVISLTLAGYFIQYGEPPFLSIYILSMTGLLAVYATLSFFFARRFFGLLFSHGRPMEWAFYLMGTIFAFAVVMARRLISDSIWVDLLLLVFILLSVSILCYTIISLHAKAKLKYEAEFSRSIISSGSDHYEKMNGMHDALRIMRHDYKYHLDTINALLQGRGEEDINQYLAELSRQLEITEIPVHCANTVINALVTNYAERCAKAGINLSVDIAAMPESISVPNYEMCIILGNLMENAVEANMKREGGRSIELIIKALGDHLTVMVRNDRARAEITTRDALPISTKKSGGLGLRSVKAVAERYDGKLMAEWDEDAFTVYILLKK
jgi:sensor histidine kinase YesM